MTVKSARTPVAAFVPTYDAELFERTGTRENIGAFYIDRKIKIRPVKFYLRDLVRFDRRDNVFWRAKFFAVGFEQRVAIPQKRFRERAISGESVDLDAAADQAFDRRPDDVHRARDDERERDEIDRAKISQIV